jgi:hypothetical protein
VASSGSTKPSPAADSIINGSKENVDNSVHSEMEKWKHWNNDNEVRKSTGQDGHSGPSKADLESSSHSCKVEERPPSVAGGARIEKSKAPFVMGTGISVPEKNRDLDGINFKENIRAPPIAESLMASQSPSPRRFQPLTFGGPLRALKPSPLIIGPSELYTEDAGHTPLRSRFRSMLDSSAVSSVPATPIQGEHGKSPFELRPSAAKVSFEQPDQHVPRVDPITPGGDRALKWPLGLTNNKPSDTSFLHELDWKLHQAAKSDTPEVPEPARSENGDSSGEPEREIQLKPALNFGSPFGAAHCGKGI